MANNKNKVGKNTYSNIQINVIHAFICVGNKLILFKRNDGSMVFGPVSGEKDYYDFDILSCLYRESLEETNISLFNGSISRTTYSTKCHSPNSEKSLFITTFFCRLRANFLNCSDIVLNPSELNGYEILDKNDSLKLLENCGELEAYEGLKRIVAEGLI
jgi:hypothetical protein